MDKGKVLVAEWIAKAEQDLGMAKLAIDNKPEYRDLICFHCQQAAEKYLKACLIDKRLSFKKTHSLVYLLDLLAQDGNIPDKLYEAAEILEDYGVEVRYPGNGMDLSDEDVNDAYLAALQIKEAVIIEINKKSNE
jgi:HEPN domain-containing protein